MRQLPHKETLDVLTTQQAATLAGGLLGGQTTFYDLMV